ncbi:hypothetical protein CDD81_3793 [Ophiocordyceps australis]|uniref:Ketoreductase (KR) domain-containing protein n=1 Tax=Ophiocordyceps australis TaxID=1399860 RepID=A0A2C5YB53_9HYPO|nr:hypothetical protein CDD81_3793 [Ophiocordyceps australis]
MAMKALWDMAAGQFFSCLPRPTEDCTGRTVIVTGANTSLGLEAARHLVRLNAAKVIIACRTVEKGEAACRDIEASTQRQGVVEVWQLDLSSFDSVKDFASRANKLHRLDVLINNASSMLMRYSRHEGYETMITVNVISTLLLSILLLPILRQTGSRFNIVPHIVTVSSEAAFLAFFPQRKAKHVLDKLKTDGSFRERYNTSKLLQLMATRKLAEAIDASHKGRVVVNALSPGLCKTELFRDMSFFPVNVVRWLMLHVCLPRSCEVGSRTLLAAAFAGDETHGWWMSSCKLRRYWPALMSGPEGAELTDKIWGELVDVLETTAPDVMAHI